MAARKVVNYWDGRMKLFGPSRAFRPLVCSSDFLDNPDDIYAASMDYVRILADLDGAGRRIVFINPSSKSGNYKRHSLVRYFFATLYSIWNVEKMRINYSPFCFVLIFFVHFSCELHGVFFMKQSMQPQI